MSIDRANYPGVPEDFPVTAVPSAVAGAQPKMNLVEEGGKFYALGTSPGEVIAAFQMCDDLVSQMVPYCQRKLATYEGNQEATVKAALKGMLAKRWCTDAQCVWIMRRVADELQWTVGDDAWVTWCPELFVDRLVMTHPSSDSRYVASKPARVDDQRRGAATRVVQGYGPGDGPLSPAQISVLQAVANEDLPKGAVVRRSSLFAGG